MKVKWSLLIGCWNQTLNICSSVLEKEDKEQMLSTWSQQPIRRALFTFIVNQPMKNYLLAYLIGWFSEMSFVIGCWTQTLNICSHIFLWAKKRQNSPIFLSCTGKRSSNRKAYVCCISLADIEAPEAGAPVVVLVEKKDKGSISGCGLVKWHHERFRHPDNDVPNVPEAPRVIMHPEQRIFVVVSWPPPPRVAGGRGQHEDHGCWHQEKKQSFAAHHTTH